MNSLPDLSEQEVKREFYQQQMIKFYTNHDVTKFLNRKQINPSSVHDFAAKLRKEATEDIALMSMENYMP